MEIVYNYVMDYIDISLPLSPQTVTYPGNQPFNIELLKTIGKDNAQLSKIVMGTHSGTHVDAPNHFIKGGIGVDRLDLSRLNGPCRVIDCTYIEYLIRQADISQLGITQGDRILFKTRNSDYITSPDFVPGFVSVALDAAQYLANRQVVVVGVDYLSVEAKGSPGHPVHKALLKHGIPIIEGLHLDHVKPGDYTLACLPLRIVNGDGAPCRALLYPKTTIKTGRGKFMRVIETTGEAR